METPKRKSAQKSAASSTRSFPGDVRMIFSTYITRPAEFRLRTGQRAAQRAIYNSSVAIKLDIMELQKKQVEKVMKVIEEEEVRILRREMVPRAQQMPLFEKPFLPQRSTRPLTVPREPSFRMAAGKGSHISCR